jgi:hypothetical protein
VKISPVHSKYSYNSFNQSVGVDFVLFPGHYRVFTSRAAIFLIEPLLRGVCGRRLMSG